MAKLLSASSGGTQRSSAQKKWTLLGRDGVLASAKLSAKPGSPPPIFRAFACSTTEVKNFCAMRPPDSATQYDLPARFTDSISSNHLLATARASSSALAKEIRSKFFTLSSAARATHDRFARANPRRRPVPTCRRRKIRGSSAVCFPSLCGSSPRFATRFRLRRAG